MFVLRQIALALLLIALLPWGAYLGKAPGPPANPMAWITDLSPGAETSARPSPDQAVQKPLVKCRQGLPGFRCGSETGTLVPLLRAGLEVPRGRTLAPRSILLPEGQFPSPRLRPPILS